MKNCNELLMDEELWMKFYYEKIFRIICRMREKLVVEFLIWIWFKNFFICEWEIMGNLLGVFYVCE